MSMMETKNALLTTCLVAVCTAASWSQSTGVKVQGTVKDNGKPIAGAEIVITNSESSATYKSKTDENGIFQIAGVPAGRNYQLEVINSAGLKIFVSQQLAFNAGNSTPPVLAIDTSDMSKTNLQAALEKRHYSREEIEAMKAQRDKAQAQNGLIKQALEAMTAKQWENAITPLKQLIAQDPDRYEFYQSLGEAQFNLAQYDDAIQSLEKGIEVANAAATFPNSANDPARKKARIAAMLVYEGNAFAKLKKTSQASNTFARATEIDPSNGLGQFNLCVMLYNAQNIDAALPVCEKSIGLDPLRPDTYFMKGRMLTLKSKRSEDGKLHALPGTVEALWKYLMLAPAGPHADDAKKMLDQIGAKVEQQNQETTK
jgi:tetratricopeptide (TPR) repeat protein